MPDDILQQREGVLRTIRRAIAAHEGMLTTSLPAQQFTPGTGLGAPGGLVGPTDTFATGYDSGTGLTTMPFVFDDSAFDGDDFLT